MEDPWANAWSQPETQTEKPYVRDSIARKPNTVSAPWAVENSTSEADVGEPSWSTGGIDWNQPSGQTSLWSPSTVDDTVENNPYGGWQLKTEPFTPADEEEEEEEEEEEKREDDASVNDIEIIRVEEPKPVSVSSSKFVSEPHSSSFDAPSSPHLSEDSPHTEALNILKDDETKEVLPSAPSEDFDNFGTFEIGVEHINPDDSWGQAYTLNEIDTNVQPWTTSTGTVAEEVQEDPKDEWELARERKLQLDRKIPPELLAMLLKRCSELFDELHKDKPYNFPEVDILNGSWRGGLKYLEEGSNSLNRVLRGASFKPPVQFRKTRIAKNMANGLKLSKNTLIAQTSPMSHMFSAKYSSAWEQSVKSRVLAKQEEVDNRRSTAIEDDDSKPVEKKGSISGGILSFWGRRKQPSQTSSEIKSALAVEKTSPDTYSSSPRASVDSKIKSVVERVPTPSSALASPSLLGKATLSESSLPDSNQVSSTPNTSAVSPTVESIASLDQQRSTSTTPAPSAVSRFWSRFSRSRTSTETGSASNSPRGSVALSTDDLNFLSDIVPSAVDEDETEDHGLIGLTNLIASEPVSDKLPPLLPQPPRVSYNAPSPSPGFKFSSDNEVFSKARINADSDDFLDFVVSPVQDPGASLHINPPHSPATSSMSNAPSDAFSSFELSSNEMHFKPTTLPANFPPSSSDTVFSSEFPILPPPIRASSTPALLPPAPQRPIQTPSKSDILIPQQPPFSHMSNVGDMKLDVFDEDDDFSEFHSASSNTALKASTSTQSSTSILDSSFDSSMTNTNLLAYSPATPDNSFGDFGDFILERPTLSTPSPPQPPKKPLPPPRGNPTIAQRRSSRAADHVPTLGLMEKAANRPGRWPAPPSPLPTILPPPPNGTGNSKDYVLNSLLDEQTVDIPWVDSDLTATPKLPPPPFMNSPKVNANLLTGATISPNPSLFPAAHTTRPTESSKQKSQVGGLSAQDLSFFEGL